MHCGHCVQSVTDSLNQIDGVSARVDLSKGCAEISLDREVGEDILTAAVERAGFSVESIQS
ncbi:MAG: heavy-metal-associated domain-containing protein [Lacrimispora saccharolytica]